MATRNVTNSEQRPVKNLVDKLGLFRTHGPLFLLLVFVSKLGSREVLSAKSLGLVGASNLVMTYSEQFFMARMAGKASGLKGDSFQKEVQLNAQRKECGGLKINSP